MRVGAFVICGLILAAAFTVTIMTVTKAEAARPAAKAARAR